MLAEVEENYNISVTSGCEWWQSCPGWSEWHHRLEDRCVLESYSHSRLPEVS